MDQLTVLLTNQVFADGGKSFFAGQSGTASLLTRTITYLLRRSDIVWELLLEHIWLIVVSISIAIVISVIIGVIISYKTGPAVVVLTICQILMTIPSMAMLAFMVPVFGIGFTTGVVALILYSLLPIVRNTYTGIKEISPAIVESAVGMGMTEWRVLTRIKIPLARPVIMAGIRTATVMIVGIGAIAAYVGAGGLGELIFQGISRSNEPMIIVGALGVSIIALAFDFILSWGERRLIAVGKTGEGKQ
ncbi:MAG: ABC transporter permease [Bacillota bacterium]|nr:ABC transporter permease [Bacillota bacterium]